MKNLKKFLFVLLTGLVALIISGCSPSGENSKGNDSGELSGEIVMWHSFTQGPRLESIQKSADEFMAILPQLDEEFKTRVSTAKAEGKVLRYVGKICEGKCKVSIVAVDQNNPLYKVKDGENALAFYTRYYQPIPLLLRGYGAGNAVTAAGIFADILRTLQH